MTRIPEWWPLRVLTHFRVCARRPGEIGHGGARYATSSSSSELPCRGPSSYIVAPAQNPCRAPAIIYKTRIFLYKSPK